MKIRSPITDAARRADPGAGAEGKQAMTIGLALLLIAAGAILRFAVTAHLSGVNIATVGTILMVIGAIGLVLSLIWLASSRRRRTAVVESHTYTEEPRIPEPGPYSTRVEERRYQDPPL